jgi:Spy/CpxP family protein refolding chaperone
MCFALVNLSNSNDLMEERKMKNRTMVRSIQVLAVTILMAGMVFAQNMPGKGNAARGKQGRQRPAMAARMNQRMGLDPATMDKIRDIRRDEQKKLIQLEADKKVAGMNLEEQLLDPKANEMDIRKAAEKLNKIHEKEAEIKLDALLAIKKNLTPEEFKKYVRAGIMMKNAQGNRPMGRGEGRPAQPAFQNKAGK